MNEYTYQGMTADEWEALANPQPATEQDLQNLGMLETPQENTQEQPSAEESKEGNKLYKVADNIGVEHPDEGKEYQKLNFLDTAKDIGTSIGVEAAHLFQKKENEWRYESKTRIGEFAKYLYRYGAGTASMFIGAGEVGATLKGVGLLNKIFKTSKVIDKTSKSYKLGSVIQKIFQGNELIKTGKNASKLAQIGAKIANNSFGGAVSGAIADFTLYRQEDMEGHMADIFGDTDNPILGYLQTKEDDTELEGRFKNAIEGIILSPIMGNAAEFVAKPLLGGALKNLKTLKNVIFKAAAGKATAKEVEQAAANVALDEIKIERFANKQDLVDKVKEIKNEAEVAGEEASQLIIDKLDIKDVPEAQKMLQTLEKGEDIFVHEDGTWDISINNWEDAYKVSPEEYNKQLKARDKAKAGTFGDSIVREGDTALEHQNEAIKSTWTNRGWIGENEELTVKNSNKIAKNYKDKWQIDNNIKVEFVDGLKVKGQEVDGNTSATKYLGKKKKPKGKLSDITIQIDKNAKNPYATLRAELEHARDIAKSTVPNQTEAHFSRYNGLNEAEVAPSYTYKKSKGKAAKTDNYTFKDAEPDGWGEKRTEIENSKGETLGYVEYTLKGDTLSIDDVFNITKGSGNGVPYVGENLIDNLLKENPNVKQIEWNATTPDGMPFKENYLNKHPELKEKTTGTSKYEELDLEGQEAYDEAVRWKNERNKSQNTGRSRTDFQRANSPDSTSKNAGTIQQTGEQNLLEKPVVSSNSRNNERGINTDTKQLQIDFNTKLQETSTPEEAINKMINGEIQPKTEADIEALINKTINDDIEISGFKFENIAEDSETFAKYIEDLVGKGEDISAYKEAFLKGDAETLQALVRKEMAATKHLSILADRLEQLGMEAPIEQQRNIVDMVVHLSNYVDDIRSGAGSLLNAQKLVNRALDTFGSMRLSQLTKEGIREFSDLLLKDIKETFNLNFTKGQILNVKEIKQELYQRIFKYGDGEFVDIISNDEVFARNFNEVLDKLIQTKGDIGVDGIYKELENLITKTQYQDAYNAALLAPKPEGKIATIKNWSNAQGGIASYYVHNLLSGLGSLAKNVGSGIMNTAYFPARKILGGYLGGGETMTKEGWNTYKSMLSSITESWEMMKQAFLKGDGKLSSITADTLNMDEGTMRGFHDWDDDNIWHKIQNFHSVMTRAMGATDEFMSQLNYRSICRAKALNQADKMAELAGKTGDEKWINETADSLFKKKFDKNGKPLDLQAYDEAKTILYQNPLSGEQIDPITGNEVQMREQTAVMKLASGLQAEANKNPLVKFIFPFVKTGANILQMNLDHNALYAIASPAQRKVLLSKTPEGALARSQVGFGYFSFLLASLWALNGGITGSAPTDQKERKALFETGWKPYSVKVGNTYISYQGYEPLHTILGFAADSTNLALGLKNSSDEDRFKKFMEKGNSTLINNFLDKAAFRTGLKQIAVLTDPNNIDEWQKAMAQTAKGFLPDVAMVQGVSTLFKRDATQPKTPYEMIFNTYFNRGLGDYRRDVFGDRQDIFGSLITTASSQGDEPEYQELSRLAEFGYNPSEIGTVVADTKLKFKDFKDPDTGRSAYDAMQEELSQTVIGGKTLREAVRELVTSSYYENLPDGIGDNEIKWSSSDETKVNALNDIFREYNDAAKQSIITGDREFTDKKGRTIKEAQEEVEIKKQNMLLNQNLSDSLQKIISIG